MTKAKKKVLGVCYEGGPNNGSHFAELADEVRVIKNASDITSDLVAVVFWGGTDISPSLYGEKPNNYCEAGNLPSKRDQMELSIMREAWLNDIGIIGVCRGAQLLCAFAGGKLLQHVPAHQFTHHFIMFRGVSMKANADHHQMMVPPDDAIILGYSENNLSKGFFNQDNQYQEYPPGFKEPEVVYFPAYRGIGIQPHPEWMARGTPFVENILSTCKEKLCL
jgi:hypothetical protein